MNKPIRDPLAEQLRGRRRAQTGKRFEASLDRVHQHYAVRGAGKVLQHYPRTIQLRDKIVRAKGGAPVDYSGVLRVPLDRAPETKYGDPHAIAFDAKVLGDHHNKFHMVPDQRQQLVQLLDFARGGGLAFLLIEVPKFNVACLVWGQRVLTRLIVGDHVMIHRDGKVLWPHVAHEGLGYDYRRCLRALIAEPEPQVTLSPRLIEREVSNG